MVFIICLPALAAEMRVAVLLVLIVDAAFGWKLGLKHSGMPKGVTKGF